MRFVVTLILVMFFLAISCNKKTGSGEQSAASSLDSATTFHPPPPDLDRISPGYCRLVGLVEAIEPPDSNAPATSACARYPCLSRIRVIAVKGYGSGFNTPFSIGSVVKLRFAYTTGASEQAVPEMQVSFPGVSVGDTITADIRRMTNSLEQLQGTPPEYIVYGYERH